MKKALVKKPVIEINNVIKNVGLNPKDIQKFGNVVKENIENQVEIFKKKGVPFLEQFLNDSVEAMQKELSFTKKYAGKIYDKSKVVAKQFEIEMAKKLIKELQKEVKKSQK